LVAASVSDAIQSSRPGSADATTVISSAASMNERTPRGKLLRARGRLREGAEDPEIARNAPYGTPVRRLDEAGAAKRPVIRGVA
jgi:hypothetical protein